MIVYLAGGVTGNCFPLWKNSIKAFESGEIEGLDDTWCVNRDLVRGLDMKIHLAGISGFGKIWKDFDVVKMSPDSSIDVFVLESFYYMNKWVEEVIPLCKSFLLDSGAFTFFSSGKDVNWNTYLDNYISFINKNKISKFFELDIDKLVGYPKVLDFRKEIENQTGVKPIPVWHKSRGKNEFIKSCEEYPYVALGGIVSKEITKNEYQFFPWFINTAHRNGAKIHGLGFTNLEGLTKYHFDSVDSTSWLSGNRFGAVYRFNGHTMEKTDRKPNQCLKDSRRTAINNFNEWVKFQHYAEKNL